MKKFIILAAVLFACHKEVKEQTHLQEVDESKTVLDTKKETAKTTVQDPSEVDTKTTRSENAVIFANEDGSVEVAKVVPDKPLKLRPGARVIGTVPLTTVTVDQNKHVGAKTTAENATATAEATVTGKKATDLTTAKETVTDAGLGWKFYLSCLAGLAIVLAAGYAYLKFIRKVAWL